jgi:ankyrin repeat protein
MQQSQPGLSSGRVIEVSLLDLALNSFCPNGQYVPLQNVAKVLLEVGAKIQDGERHLCRAAMLGHACVVKALLKAGVNDGSVKEFSGNTALDIAASFDRKDCCMPLIRHRLEKNPNEEMPDSIRNDRKLFKYWNTCKVSYERQRLTNPAGLTNSSLNVQALQSELLSLEEKIRLHGKCKQLKELSGKEPKKPAGEHGEKAMKLLELRVQAVAKKTEANIQKVENFGKMQDQSY